MLLTTQVVAKQALYVELWSSFYEKSHLLCNRDATIALV